MKAQQDNLNGSMEAFARAFSNLVKDSTSHLATKDDIANMATKDDIANMATKDDITNMATKDDITNMATKDDIANMATKDDITNMATKDDLDRVRANMATKDDINRLSYELEQVKVTVSEGYKRIYRWKDDMYKTFARKEDLRPSAFKEGR